MEGFWGAFVLSLVSSGSCSGAGSWREAENCILGLQGTFLAGCSVPGRLLRCLRLISTCIPAPGSPRATETGQKDTKSGYPVIPFENLAFITGLLESEKQHHQKEVSHAQEKTL